MSTSSDTKVGVELKPQLLTLPFEIRQKIYRHLFLTSRPLGIPSGARSMGDDFGWHMPGFSDFGIRKHTFLPVNFLRVYRAVYHEASKILYSENTFATKIWTKERSGYAFFFAGDTLHTVSHMFEAKETGFPIQRIKRYVIKVELQAEGEYSAVYDSARKVYEVLSATADLRSLHITLELKGAIEDQSLYRVLEPFSLLRNVQSVAIDGSLAPHRGECVPSPPEQYASDLRRLIEGDSPVQDLHKMLDVLYDYARKHYDPEDFIKLFYAVQDKNVQEFKRLRCEMMAEIDAYHADIRSQVFAYDTQETEEVMECA